MTKYQILTHLINEHELKIISQKNYDAQSGWSGEDLWITDNETPIFNLSGNGYHFEDSKVDEAISEITKYIENRDMKTFEAFSKWVDKIKVTK